MAEPPVGAVQVRTLVDRHWPVNGLQLSVTMAVPLQWGAALQAGLQGMALMQARLAGSQLTTQGS
ncbi:MAG TPA: hypothetical protein VGF45_24325, partial [Polyangia bacterium]